MSNAMHEIDLAKKRWRKNSKRRQLRFHRYSVGNENYYKERASRKKPVKVIIRPIIRPAFWERFLDWLAKWLNKGE